MNLGFTYNINSVNKARNELLYNSENTAINNNIFVRSYFKPTNGAEINNIKPALTLRAPGDKKGGRDSSQHIRIKKASYGNAYIGNK